MGMAGLAMACGGGETPPPAPPVPPKAPETAPTPPPQQHGEGGFAGAKARGSLRIAADVDAPPFLTRTKDGKGYEGFEYAIMQALGDRAGVPVTVVPGTFDELPGLVTGGSADLAIGQLSPSSAYQGIAFSTSYLQYSLCLVVPADSTVKALPELAGKRVGMYDDPVARQLTDVLIGASYERQLFNDYGYFEKLARHQLDAVVYDCPLARYEMTTWKDQIRIADNALNVTTYNAAVPAWDTTLLTEVNGVLKDLGDNGLLGALEGRWLGAVAASGDMETATGKVVVVKKGDTLSLIAQRTLGSPDRYKDIYEKNKDVIGPDPNTIYQGMWLRLPK